MIGKAVGHPAAPRGSQSGITHMVATPPPAPPAPPAASAWSADAPRPPPPARPALLHPVRKMPRTHVLPPRVVAGYRRVAWLCRKPNGNCREFKPPLRGARTIRPAANPDARRHGLLHVGAAEPPLPQPEALHRRAEMPGGEVRPGDLGKVVLGIGALPEQEVRDPELARGADDEVRVRQPARVERRRRSPPPRSPPAAAALPPPRARARAPPGSARPARRSRWRSRG